jgi:hypothetical protein
LSPRNGENTVWRQYPLPRLVQEFGLVRLIYLAPGINSSLLPEGARTKTVPADGWRDVIEAINPVIRGWGN